MEVILSSSSQKGSFIVWDMKRGIILKNFRQSPPIKKGCITTLNSNFVYVASDQRMTTTGGLKTTTNSRIVAWSLDAESTSLCQSFIPQPISAFIGSPCSQYIYAGTIDGSLIIWHCPSGRLLKSFIDIFQPINAMAISPTGEWLAIGCADGIIHVLSVPAVIIFGIEEAEKMSLSQHSLPITDLKFSPTSGRLYSCSADQTCKIWAVGEKSLLVSVSFPTILNCLAISPIEDCIYVGGCDGNIYKIDTWDIKTNDINIMSNVQNLQEQIFKGDQSVNCIDTNIDGSLLVAGYEDGSIKVWSSSSCQLIQTLPPQFKGSVTSLKILIKPVTITISSKIVPPLVPLANISYISEEVEVLPVRLSGTKKRSFSDRFENSEDSLAKNNQVTLLKSEISELKEINARWKLLNNQLLLDFKSAFQSQ